MKKLLPIFSVVCLFLISSFCFAESMSARYKTISEGKTMMGNIWICANKVRMETNNGIVIIRPDKKVIWTLVPDQKIFLEQAYDGMLSKGFAKKIDGEMTRKKVGVETVGGLSCEKYIVTVKQGDSTTNFFQWISKTLSIPVKTQSEDGNWYIEFSEILKGPQPASLFEIPAGFKKVDELPKIGVESGEKY